MNRRNAAAFILLVASASSALAQQQAHVNHANWALADRYTNDALQPMIYTGNLQVRFIGKSDSLYYNFKDHNGSRFVLVVPATRAKQPLFDHKALAAALTAAGRPYDFQSLPFTTVRFTDDHKRLVFLVDSTRFEWDRTGNKLSPGQRLNRQDLAKERQLQNEGLQGGRGGGGGGGRGGGFGGANADFRAFSPDSTAYVFARDHNLFIVETKGDSTPQKISSDGVVNFSFGARDTTQNQCTTQAPQDDQQQDDQGQGQQAQSRDPRVRAQVTWSPDSKSFVVTRNDQRAVKDLYLVNVLAEPRPTLCAYRYAMPGEDSVPQQELDVFRRGDKQIAKLNVDKYKDQRLFDLHFPVNGDKVRLVRRDRLQRNEELIEVDLATKQTKTLLTETTENANLERQNVRYVKAGGDFLWWSERSGWGHYYLYDYNGTFKNSVTAGDWRAESIAELDSVGRVLYFRAVGREDGEVPYYTHLYKVALDGSGLALLDPGDATHNSTLSPSKRFIVDNASRIDLPNKIVLRDALLGGKEIMPLEEMDISRLKEYGWRPPERFVVKAADGVTNIYGTIFKPFDFDSTKKYPIVANVYPGPQTEQVTYNFAPSGVQQRLAQLGIIVIQIGNRGGSPQRSNAYQHYGYFSLRDYGLADKKAGIEQLAARFSWIDIDRVGIFGHSGGGFMTAAALLVPPYNDFFKVGVSSSGNHDNNVYNQNWSEQYHGLKEIRVPRTANLIASNGRGRGGRGGQGGQLQGGQADPGATQLKASTDAGDTTNMVTKFSIHIPTNAEVAQNLKGNLLLVHGDMDNNVHPAGTIRLMNALIKNNKRFDFMLMPGKPHGYGDMQPYFTRVMMEYFAEHLIGDYYRTDAALKGK